MRVAALDVGRRRTGIAISDPSGTLARPLTTVRGDRMLHDAIRELTPWRQDEDGLELVVVGLPRRQHDHITKLPTLLILLGRPQFVRSRVRVPKDMAEA